MKNPVIEADLIQQTIEFESGKKFDKDKTRYDLLPMSLITEAADVLTFGAQKYGVNNWRQPMPDRRGRWFSALLRHLFAYQSGEKIDPESGKSHLAHVVCNAMFLKETEDDDTQC